MLSANYDPTTHRLIGLLGANGQPALLNTNPNTLSQTVTDALGNTTQTIYDSFGNPIRTVQQVGKDPSNPNIEDYTVTVMEYDGANNLIAQSQPFAVDVDTTIPSEQTDPETKQPTVWAQRSTYDQFGDVTSTTDALGNTTQFFYNQFGELATTIDPMGRHTINSYDGSGNLISTTDPSGNTTHYSYDSHGDLLSSTDPQGHTTSSTYNGQGQMTSSTSVTGVTTNYTYGPSGKVTSTSQQWINPTPGDGQPPTATVTTSSTYDADGRLTSSTDANNNTTQTFYTDDGQVDHTVDSLGNTTGYLYDASGNLIQTTNTPPAGSGLAATVTQTAYDALNRATLTLDSFVPGLATFDTPLGTATIYNSLGQAIETDTVSGAVISIEPDNAHTGQFIAVITNPGTVVSSTKTTYNPDGTVATTITDTGLETDFTYDADGRQTSATEVNVPVFNPATGANTLDNLTTSTTYNADSQQTSTTDALGNTTHYTYDADGNVLATTDPSGTATVNTYNSLGQLVNTTDPLGNVTTDAYDASGNLTSVIEPIIEIETAMHASQISNAPTTTYTYDNYGNEIAQTDANGNTTRFEYDSQGRQIAEILPLGQSDSTHYDTQGHAQTQTDFDGNVTTYNYDPLGRVSSVVYTGTGLTTQTVTYTYDALGRQQTVIDASGTTTYTYDNAGNLITSATPEGTLHYVYNALNQHTETYTTAVGGTAVLTDITYAYDTLGRLTSMSVNALNGLELSVPLVTQYYYDGAGNLAYQLQVNNGISQEYTYTVQNQIATILDKTGSTKTASFAYTYNADGEESQEVEQIGSATSNIPTETLNYTYNADGMLYSETATTSGPGLGSTLAQWAIYYGYDADGNRLETDGGDFMSTDPAKKATADEEQANFWTYNADNELSQNITYNPDQDNPSNTTTKYTYDSNGNEIELDSTTEHQQQEDGDGSDSFTFFTYDVRGEMVKYVDQNNTTTTYTYDDAGNRVKEVTPVSGHNVTTTYLIDSNNPTGKAQAIEEHVNGAATPSITYFVGVNGTQGQSNGSTVFYMLRDNRGYARVITNAAGTVTQYDQYDAYGNLTTSNTLPTTHFIPDGVLDPASSLTFHFAGRQSSSFNGDFIEQDPHTYTINFRPSTADRYTLDGDDPLDHIDPSGHDDVTLPSLLAGAGIAGLLGGLTNAGIQVGVNLLTGQAVFKGVGVSFVNGFFSTALTTLLTPALGIVPAAFFSNLSIGVIVDWADGDEAKRGWLKEFEIQTAIASTSSLLTGAVFTPIKDLNGEGFANNLTQLVKAGQPLKAIEHGLADVLKFTKIPPLVKLSSLLRHLAGKTEAAFAQRLSRAGPFAVYGIVQGFTKQLVSGIIKFFQM